MTMPEIEVVRAFNQLATAEGLSGPLQTKVMRLRRGRVHEDARAGT